MPAGRPKKIESPEKLKEYFLKYEEETKSNPFIVTDWVGKDATEVSRKKERPLTIEGFECWLMNEGIIEDLGDYLRNKDGRYTEFATICTYVKKMVRKDQVEGGMSQIYNASITQRLNGLTEKQEVNVTGEKIAVIDWSNDEGK